MRKWFVLVAAISIVVSAAGAASAALLNWEGTLTVEIAEDVVDVTGGGVATLNASAGGIPAHLNTLRLAVSRGNVTGTATILITDPDQAGNGVGAVIVAADLGTGTFAPISGGAASTVTPASGLMPMRGVAKVCILSSACTSFVSLPLTGPTTVNGVPGTGTVGIGVGGMLTGGGYGGIRLSLEAAPWTIKTTTVTDQISTSGGALIFTLWIAHGWAHAPASTTSSTAQPSGMVQLVTPAQLVTNLPLGTSDKMGGLAILVLHFIPEPGLLLLVGSGVVGLTVLGHRRRRG